MKHLNLYTRDGTRLFNIGLLSSYVNTLFPTQCRETCSVFRTQSCFRKSGQSAGRKLGTAWKEV